jgi:Na+-driven multidrug efflux pump
MIRDGKTYYTTILRLALPIGLQNLVGFAVNFADNLMVGRLGDLAIAGVFIGNQIHSMVMFITSGVGTTLVILATQYWGKKDIKSIRSLTVISIWASLGAGAIFTALTAGFPGFIAGLLSNKEDVVQASVPYLRFVGLSFVFFTVSQVLVASQRSVEKVRFGMYIALITLVYIWMSGLAAALGIMTGKLVGGGAPVEEIKAHAFRTQRFFPLVGLATGLFVFVFKGVLISFYNISPEAVQATRQLLNVHALTIIGTAYQMPGLGGLVKAGGNISFVFRNDFIFVFFVVIPSSIIAMFLKAPAWVVFLCLKCDQILKCFVALVVINRFRWIKDLTKG